MMTNVVVVPSLGRSVVGCVLLLTGAIPVVVVGPIVWEGKVVPIDWEGMVVPIVWEGKVVPIDWVGVFFSGVDAVEMKYTA